MRGMLADLRLYAEELSDQEVRRVASARPESRPALEALLRARGRTALGRRCEARWRGCLFTQLQWRLCPEAICGPLCLDEAFFTPTQPAPPTPTSDAPTCAYAALRSSLQAPPSLPPPQAGAPSLLALLLGATAAPPLEPVPPAEERLSHGVTARVLLGSDARDRLLVERLYESVASLSRETPSSELALTLGEWGERWEAGRREAAESALFLALWLCDDIRTPLDTDVRWYVRYSSALAVAPRIALAFRSLDLALLPPPRAGPPSPLPSPLALSHRALAHVHDCPAAANYYYAAAHYSAAHFEDKAFGVDHPRRELFEDMDRSRRDGLWSTLSPDATMHMGVDVGRGDAAATVWLAQRYLWGDGTVPRNETHARLLFERAAPRSSEAKVFLGTFHAAGGAGLGRNTSRALQLFLAAATAEHPSERAFFALGNFYAGHFNNSADRNRSLSMRFYMQAAARNSYFGHYAYGRALLDDVETNFTYAAFSRGLHHVARAAAMGDPHAVTYLANGLLDPGAWLAALHRRSLILNTSAEEPAPDPSAEPREWRVFNYSYGRAMDFSVGRHRVVLSHPYRPGCAAALPLLKHLAEMFLRGRQLSQRAAAAYVSGDLWRAMELADEGADLGIETAQLNALRVYGLIGEKHCAAQSSCRSYLDRMTALRLRQLANAGDVRAKRLVADRLARADDRQFPHDGLMARGLYAEAGEAGDGASLVALGWMAHAGAGMPRNESLARALFYAALQMEGRGGGGRDSSSGVAPLAALLAAHAISAYRSLSSDGADARWLLSLAACALGVLVLKWLRSPGRAGTG